MGILDSIGKKKTTAKTAMSGGRGPGAASTPPGATPPRGARPGSVQAAPGAKRAASKPGSRKRGKTGAPSQRDRIQSAAAPLHDRRRRLVGARETTLRDLGGLMLEMYKRNRFREELLLDKCEEILAIEVEIAHVDQRLFQLSPPNAAGMRPIGRCDCGAPIHPGQNFCGVCGRSFATLTQSRNCVRCGSGLRPGDQFCATCGNEAPDALQALEAAPGPSPDRTRADATTLAASAVAETVIIDVPPLDVPSVTTTSPATTTPAPAPAPAPVAAASGPAPTPEPAPAPATERGFDWNAEATPIAEAAIAAAVESIGEPPAAPVVPPFSGFPTAPTPGAAPHSAEPATSSMASPPTPSPDVDLAPPTITDSVTTTVKPDAKPEPETPIGAAAKPARFARKPKPEAASTPAPAAAKDDRAAARAAAKQSAQELKARQKLAKARAKEKARAAREARKRGGS